MIERGNWAEGEIRLNSCTKKRKAHTRAAWKKSSLRSLSLCPSLCKQTIAKMLASRSKTTAKSESVERKIGSE